MDYTKIRRLYNVALLDFDKATGKEHLDQKRKEASEVIIANWKRQVEEKQIRSAIEDPRTVRRERTVLIEKLKSLTIQQELARQRIAWLLSDTPFTQLMLENDIKEAKEAKFLNKNARNVYDDEAENYKPSPFQLKIMARDAREAREALGLQMIEMRALKNRLQANSIASIVQVYRDYQQIQKGEHFEAIVQDSLLSKYKMQCLTGLIQQIVAHEDKIVKFDRIIADQATDPARHIQREDGSFFNVEQQLAAEGSGDKDVLD